MSESEQQELERLRRWFEVLENAPDGETKEIIRERCLSSSYLQPVIETWKQFVEKQKAQITELTEHLQCACIAAGFTDTVSVEELSKVIDAQDPTNGKPMELTEALRKLARYAPTDEYRLTDEDLHRIINSCGPANDLGDAVKDLFSAHYEIETSKDIAKMADSALTLAEHHANVARVTGSVPRATEAVLYIERARALLRDIRGSQS